MNDILFPPKDKAPVHSFGQIKRQTKTHINQASGKTAKREWGLIGRRLDHFAGALPTKQHFDIHHPPLTDCLSFSE